MKTALSHRQTKTPGIGSFGLPVLAGVKALSPYYQVGLTGRLTHSSENPLMKAIVGFQQPNGANFEVNVGFVTGSSVTDGEYLTLSLSGITDDVTYRAAITSAINTYASAHSLTLDEGIIWPYPAAAIAPSVYQTIVSQTSTGAPAVSGSLTPLSTYTNGVTFTWARSSAGVYTLTASSAVFNTSGKTAVIIGPLNNLNGQYTAVITSSTVITITTAVQSLAVLGLVGFTATPTDAMLTKTAVQVLTYA